MLLRPDCLYHFLHGAFHADVHGTSDDAVPDIQFLDAFNGGDGGDVPVVESVTRKCAEPVLAGKNGHVGDGYGDTTQSGILVTDSLDIIQNLSSLGCAVDLDTFIQDLLQHALAYMEVNFRLQHLVRIRTIYEAQILRNYLIKEELSEGGCHHTGYFFSGRCGNGTSHIDLLVKSDLLVLKSKRNGNSDNILFIDAAKEFKPGKNMNTLEELIKKGL